MKLSTKILPQPLLDAVKHSRPAYTAARRARFALGTRRGARVVPGLRGRVHYNDFMLSSSEPAHVEGYRRGAQEFVGILEKGLRAAGCTFDSVQFALEVGCGYGRIVRELGDRLPTSRVYISDVIDEAARFTAAEFGATQMPLVEAAGPEFRGRFDLVYLLSVYTHLRRDLVQANLRAVSDVLGAGGVAVFTIHGLGSAQTAERYGHYWLDKSAVLDGLAREGYFYARYPYYYDEYGVTWFTEEGVRSLVAETAPELEFLAYLPMALDEHQDVFVYRRP